MSEAAQQQIARLLDVMARLRDPREGCPWDQQQTFDTIAPYTIEEAYEVADAIARRDMTDLPDELGDLLFQVVYHARMAEEAGAFEFADVARAITDKMIRRHPQIFPAETGAVGAAPGWEEQKDRRACGPAAAGHVGGDPRRVARAHPRVEADGAGGPGRFRLEGCGGDPG